MPSVVVRPGFSPTAQPLLRPTALPLTITCGDGGDAAAAEEEVVAGAAAAAAAADDAIHDDVPCGHRREQPMPARCGCLPSTPAQSQGQALRPRHLFLQVPILPGQSRRAASLFSFCCPYRTFTFLFLPRPHCRRICLNECLKYLLENIYHSLSPSGFFAKSSRFGILSKWELRSDLFSR